MTAPAPVNTKPAWPLLALAALAFVPVLGFVLGAIAVTWGLVTERPRARLAVILGASGALLNLVGAAAFSISLGSSPAGRTAIATVTQQDLVKLVFELERFRGTKGRYPASLRELAQSLSNHPINIYDSSVGLGLPRVYTYRVAPDSQSYDLFAVGSDGKAGTADDLRPPIPDSLRSQTGYVPRR